MEQIIVAIADDNGIFRSIAKYIIEKAGGSVLIEATNGKDLIERINKGDIVPHICLLDVNMPILDGYATTNYLTREWPSIDVIGQTAYLTEEVYQLMKKNGACEVIAKKDQFIHVLREVMEKRMRKNHRPVAV